MANLTPGDPAPWFTASASNNPKFCFNTVGGRYIVLCFFGSAITASSQRILGDIARNRERFDDQQVCFFGVSIDVNDQLLGRVQQQLPGIRFFWDFDQQISRLYGTIAADAIDGSQGTYRPFSIVLDPAMRTLAVLSFDPPETHVPRLLKLMDSLPPIGPVVSAALQAPVLVIPRVFEPEFCRELVGLYERHGGEESGFMREEDGKTVLVVDYAHKRRRDYNISDERVRQAAMFRIHRRLVPEIKKVFQFNATRMERYIVACYEAETGGHFQPHRDNTTQGTAHRRFAVTINLNAEEYEGGDLRFPEYCPHTYRASTGGAVVFSCSLLHEATPITKGTRFVFLPFLYDDEAAEIRKQNNPHLADSVPRYDG